MDDKKFAPFVEQSEKAVKKDNDRFLMTKSKQGEENREYNKTARMITEFDKQIKTKKAKQKIDEIFFILQRVFWWGLYPAFVILIFHFFGDSYFGSGIFLFSLGLLVGKIWGTATWWKNAPKENFIRIDSDEYYIIFKLKSEDVPPFYR